MYTKYLIYLNTLTREQKSKQAFLVLISFFILFMICGFLEFLKLKYLDETKNSLFQKFLKKL